MFCAFQFKQPYIFFSVTCRSEIVIAYGALYDHSAKRPKITQFFNAGKAPPADGKAAPPPKAGGSDGKAGEPQKDPAASKAVPAVPRPGAAPTPKAGSADATAVPKAAAAPKAVAATTATVVPKAVAATATPKAKINLAAMQRVAEVSEPPMKVMIGPDEPDGLSLQSMALENRKLKKMTVLMANVAGKLVRSSGGAVPPK